jgi:hypothetical protein
MQPEGSLPCSQGSSTGPYPEPDNPVHTTQSYLSKIHFTNFHLPTSWFSQMSFLLAFPSISYIHSSSPHSCYLSCPSRPLLLGHSNYTCRRVQVMKLLNMQFPHPPATSPLFGSNILFSTLFSDTLSLCSSLNVTDQVSQPCRTTGKIIVFCILIFTFLDSRRENKRFRTEW